MKKVTLQWYSTISWQILYKNEYLIVTNWNVDDGYSAGYKRNDPQKKGKFPTPLVRKCSEKNKENEDIYNTIRNNNNNDENENNNNNEGLPTYKESVNVQPFVNAAPMLYQNPNYYYPYAMAYNPSFVIPPPVVTSSQYTVPFNANQPYLYPMNQQPSVVSGTPTNVSIPTSSYTTSPVIQQPTAPLPEASSTHQQQPETSSNQQDEKSSNQQQQQQNNSSIPLIVPQPLLYTSNPSANYR